MAGEGLKKALARYRARYQSADRKERSQVLDELCAATGYHCKYAIFLLRKPASCGTAAA